MDSGWFVTGFGGYLNAVGNLVVASWRRVLSSPVLTLNGYVAFNLPRTVTAVGALLLSGLIAVHVYLLTTQPAPPIYLVGYVIALAVGCVIALVVYLTSRIASLPGLEALIGRWDVAAGTFAMVFAAGFVAVHITVLSGVNVAYPQRQSWHD